jgi:hypothetical protein
MIIRQFSVAPKTAGQAERDPTEHTYTSPAPHDTRTMISSKPVWYNRFPP